MGATVKLLASLGSHRLTMRSKCCQSSFVRLAWLPTIFWSITTWEIMMRQFFLTCVGLVLLVLAAPLATVAQVYSTSAKPAANNETKTWTAPRKADGRPDLEGIWSNASNTPLERPKGLGTKEFYTADEFAALVAKRGFLGDRGGPQEVHYDFVQYGMDALQSKFASNLRTSVIIGPEGRIPRMLPEAVKRNAERTATAKAHEFEGPEYRSLTERCIVYGELEGPPMLPPMYNNNMLIVQNPGYVAILNEMYHDTRIIPTDGRPHLEQNIRQWRGDSIGRWEGDTLVVDTTNFTDKTHFRGSSENLHVVERFSRTSKETILYQFTVEDPATWAKPWSGELVMGPAVGAIYEFACNEGNYGLADILSGARAEENRSADEVTKNRRR